MKSFDIGVLSKKFTKFIKSNKEFLLAYDIVRNNCSGKIWLIGGALSRNLSNLIHGSNMVSDHDFDFIVESKNEKIKLPSGWYVKPNSFGNPKLVGEKFTIDLAPADTIIPDYLKGSKSNIENFLSGVPFTPQAIIYDIQEEMIVGKIGLESLKKKVFAVNNLENAKNYASKKGLALGELIKKKAKSMGFTPKTDF